MHARRSSGVHTYSNLFVALVISMFQLWYDLSILDRGTVRCIQLVAHAAGASLVGALDRSNNYTYLATAVHFLHCPLLNHSYRKTSPL